MDSGSICGFRQIYEWEGHLQFIHYYGPAVPTYERRLFQGLFEKFLAARDVSVMRYPPPVACPNCLYKQERAEVVRRIDEAKGFIVCADCGEKIELPKGSEPIVLSYKDQQIINTEQVTVGWRTNFEAALVRLKGVVRDRATKEKAPQCFISYAWDKPESDRWVEKLAMDLKNAGVQVTLDRWHMQIGSDIALFVSLIDERHTIIVIGTPLYREKYENELSKTGSVVAAEFDLISKGLLGTEKCKKTVLPVLLTGDVDRSFPPLLGGKIYADFRYDESYFASLFDLILTVYAIPFNLPAIFELREQLRVEPRGRPR